MDERHEHGHSCGHEHGHAHYSGSGHRKAITAAFFITAGFMVVEAAGGLLTGSMALLSDAMHMLTDAAALGVSFFASRLSALKPDSAHLRLPPG